MTLQAAPAEPIDASAKSGGFVRDAIGVAISRMSVRIAQFFATLLIARMLGPEGRGLVSALQVPSQLAVNISEMGIRQSTAFHLGRKIFPLERVQPTLLTMVPMASGLAILLSLLYFNYANVAEGNWTLRLLAVQSIPLSLTASYASGVFLGRQRIAEFRRTSWRPAAISLALVVVLVWGARLGVSGAIIANTGAATAACGYALYLLAREVPLRWGFDREVASQLQRRGIAYAASLVVLLLNYRIMILLLARLGTLTEVGLYAQATAIAELIWEVPTVLGALLLSRAVNAKDPMVFSRKVVALARLSFVGAVGISVALAIVAKYVFPILYGARFERSASICVILLPGIVSFVVFKVLNSDLAGRGKPWASMLVKVPVLGVNIALGWALIVRDGAEGAAFASSLCYVASTIGCIIVYSRLVRMPLLEMLLPQPGDGEMILRSVSGLRRRRG